MFKMVTKGLDKLVSSFQRRGQITREIGVVVKEEYGEAVRADFEKTTMTWKDHHPVFIVEAHNTGKVAKVFVYTTDRTWLWLNNGTSVRYATMEEGFAPKTRFRQFTSYPGVGGKSYVSKKRVRPGIEARMWTFEAKQKYKDRLGKSVLEIARKALSHIFRRS